MTKQEKKYIEQKTKQELIEIIERAQAVLSSNFDLHCIVDDIYNIMLSPQTEGARTTFGLKN